MASSEELVAQIRRLERAARPLEPGTTRRKTLTRAAVAMGERFLRKIDTLKAFERLDDPLDRLLAAPIAEHGTAIDDTLRLLERDVLPPGLNAASGGHLGYIPGGGIYHAALGDFLAAVTNKYSAIHSSGPGAVRIEQQLIRWVADLVGYPATAGGNLASGGSVANLIAVTCARDARRLKGADVHRAVIYLTEHTHHCIGKALRVAGLGEAIVRTVSVDDRYRMIPAALESAISSDRTSGLLPLMIVANAGTTNTGVVDPLDAIGRIARRQDCWFHVDAAYGGFFLLTEQGKELMRGIELSDSAVLDPHKGLFLPYGLGTVVVRDIGALLESYRATANYLQDAALGGDAISPAMLSPEQTKHFRALRMWLPLKVLGVGPFRAALEEKLLLARYFFDEVQSLGFQVGPPPDLSVVPFRFYNPGMSSAEIDQINERLTAVIREDGRVFMSSTRLNGQFWQRAAVLSFRTHVREIRLALEVLRRGLEVVG